jgi:hypothetical protein
MEERTRRICVVTSVASYFTPGKYPSERTVLEAGGTPVEPAGPYEEERNLLTLLGIEPKFFGVPGRSVVPILTGLSKLHLLCSKLY